MQALAFADADHAGEHDSKSTSGCFQALVGPNTYFPLTAYSKKQTSISISSTESEVVCANLALRTVGLPSSALWSVLLKAGGGSTGSQQTCAPRKGDACLAKFPDQDLASQVGKSGRHELIDGRIAILNP